MHDVPNVVQGEWGPFRPNFPVEVPLWLALALQKKKCCRIQIPAWMHVQNLEGMPLETRSADAAPTFAYDLV